MFDPDDVAGNNIIDPAGLKFHDCSKWVFFLTPLRSVQRWMKADERLAWRFSRESLPSLLPFFTVSVVHVFCFARIQD